MTNGYPHSLGEIAKALFDTGFFFEAVVSLGSSRGRGFENLCTYIRSLVAI